MTIDFQLLTIGIILHIIAWLLIHSAVMDMMEEADGECWLVKTLRSKIVVYHLRIDTLSAHYINTSQVSVLRAKAEFCTSLLNYLSTVGFKV